MSNVLYSVSGKYYVGMKKADVNRSDLAEFRKIDKDRDNILDGSEICDYRDLECDTIFKKKEETQDCLDFTTLGLCATATALAPSVLGWAVAMTGMIISQATAIAHDMLASDGSEERAVTEAYRRDHRNDPDF